MRRAWARSTHAPYPAPLPGHLLTDATVPGRIRADLIAWQQVGVMWQAPPEEVEQALKEVAGLVADSDDETSLNMAAANAAADRLVSRCPPGVATGDHCWASALCADTRGRPEVALAALAPVLERLRRSRFYFATWYPSRLTQVAALAMRAGDAEQAGVVVQAAAELSRRNPGADLWERDARSDAARAALSAGQAYDDLWWLPEVMRMRAAHDDAAAAFSRLRTAAQMASAQGSVTLLLRCERDLAALPPAGVRQVR